MQARIILEVTSSSPDEQLSARCSYKHHRDNRGTWQLVEQVRFSLICRRC
ncbi:MAG: hypothetical protein QHH07_09035 [Sedimentisphaerales bacterium]|nr:hypothetical protein [Sedimentisphaerales bacterium]